MKILDGFSAYFSSIATSGLKSAQELEKHIKENPQSFSYGDATFPKYEGYYQSKGSTQRKIVAIPLAIFSGLVKSIYHLAKAIFYGIPRACIGDGSHFFANIYRFTRNLEEALGWIVTLFNDKRGSYLIQESLFHNACYSYFEEQLMRSVSGSISYKSHFSFTLVNGVEIPYFMEAREITLLNFSEMGNEEQQATIEKFKLKDSIDALGGQEAFFQKLTDANKKMLALVNVIDLKMNINTSKTKYALVTDEEFRSLTLNQVQDASTEQITFISKRLEEFRDEPALSKIPDDILSIPVIKFRTLPGSKITDLVEIIPANIFSFFTDIQIQEVDLVKASQAQLQKLFRYIDGVEEKRRFALMSSDQVQAILSKLDEYSLKLISDEQLKKLDLTVLSGKRLAKLFCYIDGKEEKRRFALMSSDQVQAILSKLDEYSLKLISDEQLKKLDLTVLSGKRLAKLFCYIDGKEEKRRFALISSDQVNDILSMLDDYILNLISDEQFKDLEISKLSIEQVNALLPTWSKDAIREEWKEKSFSYSSTYINGKHTVSEQFGISEKEIEKISLERKNANIARFKILSPTQINSIRYKLTQDNLELIDLLEAALPK
ncbi:MAG: hypothetical protein WC222_03105 [Parachlamydiales bacterium]|jgi:hypothetical protein